MSTYGNEDVVERFRYHPPVNNRVVKEHELVRTLFMELAEEMNHRLPKGREASLAITKLEEAMFWANAAIARNHSFYGESK